MKTTHATHVGRRNNNEDSYLVAPELGVFAVADGLGGHAGGDTASRVAVTAIREVFEAKRPRQSLEATLREALVTANACILSISLRPEFRHLRGMATTVVALACEPRGSVAGWIAWAGDSRCYRLRDHRLALLTDDHVVVKPMLHRCIGAYPNEAGEVSAIDMLRGDVYVLCSDGLTDALDDAEIERVLGHGGDAESLVATAIAQGDARQDNVSVVVVRV